MASKTRPKIVILISGPHGSGKTTVARAIARRLGLRYLSSGEIFRRKAEEMGMDLIEFTKYVEKNPEIDYEIDNITKREIRKGDVVFDSQLAYFFAKEIVDPSIIKISIMIYASFDERVRRLMKREGISYEEASEEITVRERSEQKRFKKLYGVDLWNLDDFDVVINTSQMDKDDAIELCLGIVEKLINARKKQIA